MSVWSLILLVPLCLLAVRTGFFDATWLEIGAQFLLQGLVSGLIALTIYGMAVERLGASGAAAFAALAPVLVILLGLPVLGEHPDAATLLAGACVCVGVFLASGVISRPR